MSATSRWLRSLGIVVVVAAVAIGAAVYLGRRDLTVPAASPVVTGIDAHAKEIRTVPDVGTDTRRKAAREIADAIERVYTAALTRPVDSAAGASPSPGPARRVRDLFTTGAVAALKKSPDVFDLGPLVVTAGTANFSGVITFVGKDAKDALIELDFVGRATPIESTEPAVRVHQRGTLGLRRTQDGWLVQSFDLRLATRPESTPSPSVKV
jgi:hypothetical protein